MRLRKSAVAAVVAAAIIVPTAAVAGPTTPPCVNAPNVNSRCEKWVSSYTDGESYAHSHTDLASALVASSKGDRLYYAGTTSVDGVPRITVAALDSKNGRTRWITHGPSTPWSAATDIIASPDGKRLFVAGYEIATLSLTSNPYDIAFVRALSAANGKTLWTKTSSGLGGHFNVAVRLAISRNGRTLYSTGDEDVPGPYQRFPVDIRTSAYNAKTGKSLWAVMFNGQSGDNEPTDIALSPRGDRVYVTGESQYLNPSPTPLYRYVTLCYDARRGHPKWGAYVKGVQNGTGAASALAVSPHGDRVFVTGQEQYAGTVGAPLTESLTVAYSGRSGNVVWRKSYQAQDGQDAGARAIAVAPKSGDVVVVGSGATTERAAGHDTVPNSVATVTALSMSTGKMRWARTYQQTGLTSNGDVVAVAPNGRIYAGVDMGGAGLQQYPGLVAYSGNGKQLWAAQYAVRDPQSGGFDTAVALAVNRRNGQVYELAQIAQLTSTVCGLGVTRCSDEPTRALFLAYSK